MLKYLAYVPVIRLVSLRHTYIVSYIIMFSLPTIGLI